MLNSIFRTVFLALFCGLNFFAMIAAAQVVEKLTTQDDQTAVAITIYNDNLALIKDQRKVRLDKGTNRLAFRGVSAKMRPETAMLRSLSYAEGVKVIEQNFDYDLLTPGTLLEKYVGREIRVARINPASGKETIEKATVLSTHQGVVLNIGGRIETNHQGRFIFDDIPENLRDQPTLATQLISSTSQPQQLELSYLSSGLSWKADYVAELNADNSQLDLLGWVTLNNVSGTRYNNAKLQLVAGDVNQVQHRLKRRSPVMVREMARVAGAKPMVEESLFEYHLYSLGRSTRILNNQTKQVSLLSASAVPATKVFVLRGSDYYYSSRYGKIAKKLKIAVFVQFNNQKGAGLGLPIPKGIVRVYKKDSKGNAQFVGEDHIDHTAKNDSIRLKLGYAFDLTATKKQTEFHKRTPVLPGRNTFESAFQMTLKNAKSEAVTVIVREPVPGDWEMLEESHPHKKIASNVAEWQINIPAESSKTLDYRVLVKY